MLFCPLIPGWWRTVSWWCCEDHGKRGGSGLRVLPCYLDIGEKTWVDHIYRINFPHLLKRPGLAEFTDRTCWSFPEGEQEPGGGRLNSTDTEAGELPDHPVFLHLCHLSFKAAFIRQSSKSSRSSSSILPPKEVVTGSLAYNQQPEPCNWAGATSDRSSLPWVSWVNMN